MTALTVACVWVQGPVPYTAEYVIRLERMVRRYLARPFSFVCLTDQPWALPKTMRAIPIGSLRGVVPDNGVGFWNKLRLFDPAIGLEGRVVFFDLDTLIVAPLDPIVDVDASLAMAEDELRHERPVEDRDGYGRRIHRKLNASVIVFEAGTQSHLFTTWTPSVAQTLSTDQDWVALEAPHAQAMPMAWFPRISRVQPPWPPEAKVVLCKKPKNLDAVLRWPWFNAMWGGWAA